MDQTPNIIQIADDILSSERLNEEFLEHHGVKGQRHGVRRYQNNDGSLTALGRQHYGIFGRLRRHYSPEERGYREAVKQKERQQKIAVQKAKYAGNLKKMLKHPKLFTDQEIDQQIAYDTRRQAAINRLSELRNFEKNSKKNEKELNRERKEAKKEADFEKEMQREAIRSQERQHKLEQKTLLDVQKQRDKAQAEREQAAREYQTQQKIAEGKTILGRLQKGAKLTAAVMGIASNTSKTIGYLKDMGFDLSKVEKAKEAVNKAKETASKVKESAVKVANEMPKNTEPQASTKDEYTNEKGQKMLPAPKESKQSRKEKRKQHEAELRDEIEKSAKREKDYQRHTQEANEWEGIYDTAVSDKNKEHTNLATKGTELGGNFSEADTKRILKVKERAQAQAALDELDEYDAMMSSSLTKQGQSVSKKTKNMVADIVAKVKGEPKPSDLKKAELIRNEMARKEQRKNLKATIDSVSDEEYESVKSMVRDRMASREKQKQTIDEIRIKQSEKRAAEREKQKAEAQARLQRQREWIAEQEKEQQNKMEEREQLEEAREMARDIKQAVTTRARLTPGPQSELTKAVTSMSVDKLAKAMSGPIDDVPKPLSILNSKSMLEKIINPDPSYLESLRRFVRHSEMEEETEDAGEIEDAE